jgi:hypothetical protein
VRRHRQRARKVFDQASEVKARPTWVPAPMLIGNELIHQYEPPASKASDGPYVAGLKEIKARLVTNDERWTISIEGPGGVGKSALAFEIARWASDSRATYRLAQFPILPVLLESAEIGTPKTKTLDDVVAAKLRFVMNVPKVSDRLLQALLRRKRVLAVFDGFSETSTDNRQMIHPEEGAAFTHALVLTSRISTNLPDSLVIRPQGLTLAFVDRILDGLIAANVGPGRFNDEEREELRLRVRALIESARDGLSDRQLPMIFIKLMIERADQLLIEGKQLVELPTTLAELVTEYTEQLLRNEQNLTLAVQQARIAAHVCMGKERSPAARSENFYTEKGLSKETLDKFVTAGLMVQSGNKSDPFFKFELDPIAEQLNANRIVIAIRDASADQTELDELTQQWEQIPEDFIGALRRAAVSYIDTIRTTHPALYSGLWPGKVNATDSDAAKPIDQGMRADGTPEVNVAENQFPPLPRFFVGKVLSSLSEALAISLAEQKPLFAVIYDSKHRSQSKLNYSLGYFLEYETTKNLIRDNFVQALLDVHSPGVRQYVPTDDLLENCLLLVLQPNGNIVRREGVYANPDEGLTRTRSILQSVARPAALTSTSLLPALEWDNHLGHQYQVVGNSIYTIGITFSGKNISDKPVQLQSAKIISGIIGASADMVVETIAGSQDPSDSNPISPNALVTLKTEFSGPTGLLAQEFINSWGLMYLSLIYDGEPHEVKITEQMSRKLYEAFRPYPLDPNPTAVQVIKWNKDGTVGKSTKLHGYYQIRKEYVEEPGVEEDRYRVYYQAGTHSFAADGDFILTCHMHGFKTLEEAQFASERDSAVVASHLGL